MAELAGPPAILIDEENRRYIAVETVYRSKSHGGRYFLFDSTLQIILDDVSYQQAIHMAELAGKPGFAPLIYKLKGIDMDFDFKDVPEQTGFSNLPPGEYLVKVDKVTPGKTKADAKNPNAKKISIQLKVVAGPFSGRILFDEVLLEGNIGKLKNLLKGLGYDVGGKLTGWKPSDIIGKRCGATVDIEPEREYQGKVYKARNKVDRYNLVDVPKEDDEFSTAEEKDPLE